MRDHGRTGNGTFPGSVSGGDTLSLTGDAILNMFGREDLGFHAE